MPRKDDFPLDQYEISQVAGAMPGKDPAVSDDEQTLMLSNDLMEVTVERSDSDDPESEIVHLVSATAEDQVHLDQFVSNLSQ